MDNQISIKKSVQFSGIGLHTGKVVTVTLHPGKPDSGIVFIRTDVSPHARIPALNSYVVDTRLSTNLGKDGVTIATVEHLMSAVWGLGIDNLEVEINGPEVPILDGSSSLFAKGIRKTGLVKQSQPRRYFVITKPLSISEDDRYCYLLPHKTPKFSCSIEFKHPAIGKQSFEIILNEDNYYRKIAHARTFGFLKDVEALRKRGLIAGGSLDNAIVLDDHQVMNEEGLRYEDEFVRHKLLDTIGDIALMGVRILGHLVTHKSGHALHSKLIHKALIEECGHIIGAKDESDLNEAIRSFQPIIQAASV